MISFFKNPTRLLVKPLILISLTGLVFGNLYHNEKGQKVLVATNTIIADALRFITQDIQDGGVKVYKIHTMASYGLDPHHYRTTRVDRIMAIKSELIFRNGLNLESKLHNMLKSLDRKIICLADNLPRNQIIYDNVSEDPHIWMNPELWTYGIKHMTNALVKLDQKNATLIKARSLEYIEKMLAIHNKFKALFRNAKPKPIIIQHNSFAYISEVYNLNILYLMDANIESQVSYSRVIEIANVIVDNNIKYIFDNTLTARYSLILKDEVAARGGYVKILGPLLVDYIERPGKQGDTYFGLLVFTYLHLLFALDIDTRHLKDDSVLGKYYVDIQG